MYSHSFLPRLNKLPRASMHTKIDKSQPYHHSISIQTVFHNLPLGIIHQTCPQNRPSTICHTLSHQIAAPSKQPKHHPSISHRPPQSEKG
ncbi:hypothetical protein BDD12DRAFT_296835 [Trichophaea hybrida]|nr:hypothetical protein BDD12DRAFT_296835 [Trichophaea hybrida]